MLNAILCDMLIRATFIFYFCESRPVPPVPQYSVEMRKEEEIIVVEKRKYKKKRKKGQSKQSTPDGSNLNATYCQQP